VRITEPGSSVVSCERKDMICHPPRVISHGPPPMLCTALPTYGKREKGFSCVGPALHDGMLRVSLL
jgi:hypothetical protein